MGMFFTGVCGACCQALVDISAELIVLGFFEITLFRSKYDLWITRFRVTWDFY
jgi:hypothetical protein